MRGRYLLCAPPTAQGFLRWVQVQSRSQDTLGIHKNSPGLVNIPLQRGASGARL